MSKFDSLIERFAVLIRAEPCRTARRLPRLPHLYATLVEGYDFAAFELGPLLLFGTVGSELRFPDAALKDAYLANVVSRQGFVQIGRPAGGSYDPVCLRCAEPRDSAVLRIDHEEILLEDRIRVTAIVTDSLSDFIERAINGEFGDPQDP